RCACDHGGAWRRERRPVRSFGYRKRDAEACATADAVALRADFTSVEGDEVLHDGEAQPEPTVATRGRTVRLTEPLEEVGQELRCNTLTAVFHDHARGALPSLDRHRDVSSRLGELDGVSEKIRHHLLQPCAVAHHLELRRLDQEMKPDLLAFRRRTQR